MKSEHFELIRVGQINETDAPEFAIPANALQATCVTSPLGEFALMTFTSYLLYFGPKICHITSYIGAEEREVLNHNSLDRFQNHKNIM